jgi:hypothetical protein
LMKMDEKEMKKEMKKERPKVGREQCMKRYTRFEGFFRVLSKTSSVAYTHL